MTGFIHTVRGQLPTFHSTGFLPVVSLPLLDLYPNALAAYSLRKLSNAYGGSALRLRRSSDNAEADIGFTVNGDFDAGAASTHLSGSNGFITKMYDQTGHGYHQVQPTAGIQPNYSASGLKGKPTGFYDRNTANQGFMTDTTTLYSVSHSNSIICFVCVASCDTNFGSDNRALAITGLLGTGGGVGYDNDQSFTCSRGAFSSIMGSGRNGVGTGGNLNITSTVPFIFSSLWDGAVGKSWGNGASLGSPTTCVKSWNSPSALAMGGWAYSGNVPADTFQGEISELIYWDIDQSSRMVGIHTAINSYYGIY